jgi:hypothetical protein
MRRLLVVLSLASASLAAAIVGPLALVACGGNDKPPLTPDSLEPSAEHAEAGAPSTPSTPSAPAGTAKPAK